MIIEKFIKNGIHYIRAIYDSGTIVIYPDPEFQENHPLTPRPPLPPLISLSDRLNFIIDVLHLKDGFLLAPVFYLFIFIL